MLSIFDQAAAPKAECLLLLDGLCSVARQWCLRPEFWGDSVPEQKYVADGVPSFYSLEPYRPRTPAILHGMVLSVAFFWVVCYGIRYSWAHILHVRIPQVQVDTSSFAQFGQSQETTRFSPSLPQARPDHEPAVAPLLPLPMLGNRSTIRVAHLTNPAHEPLRAEESKVSPNRLSSSAPNIAPRIRSPLEDYIGTYMVHSPNGLRVCISAVGGHLVMEVDGQSKRVLIAVSKEMFMVVGKQQWIEFVRDRDG
ncbi:MAG TPA: hypothetical protein VEK33_01150, partial [Terriglobales bacterium]|nr:hypothetical protein [Terriglobales bacterium]